MTQLDILCLMGLFPDEYRKEIDRDSIRGQQNAADKLQQAFVKGLSSAENVQVHIVNSLYIGSYPMRYRKLMIPTFPFRMFDRVEGINVGFCNLTGYKMLSRYHTAKRHVDAWARNAGQGHQKVLMIYALTRVFTKVAAYVKNRYPDIKVCIIVPDLPEYMRLQAQKSIIYDILKKQSIRGIRKDIRAVDSYVLLTDAMKEWFGYQVKYSVVEGIAGEVSAPYSDGTREKKIIYAGGISRQYGVLDLVDAFIHIGDHQWELILYGDGPDLDLVRERAKAHKNIKIMGLRPNQEVILAQKRASLLVNPRKNQDFTRYSFPSKVLEYMSSGTAMLAYKLDGVPDAYDPFYYQIPQTEDGMRIALRRVMSLPEEEREKMGESARDFVAKYKNPVSQCEKVLCMLRDE